MKRVIILIVLLGIFIIGFYVYSVYNENFTESESSIIDVQIYDVKHFSYQMYLDLYENGEPGIRVNGFNNIEEIKINNKEQAIERAKKEVTIEYNQITVAYDEKMWQIEFSTKGMLGSSQSVYISENGTTKLIAYGE